MEPSKDSEQAKLPVGDEAWTAGVELRGDEVWLGTEELGLSTEA
ncbi:hypothetical protein QN345_00725 [Cryobacterium sp. 10I1]|nr:hypothetical protein [Cryobacterium sp. 10I1]MEB0303863.1 hypothetical protein [Cryobacterium sp. 10I1]